jgi:hypothetical protein
MASVISEATADVDDVYEDNAPDLVCCAHVADTNAAYELDDERDEPLFVTEANNKAEEYNERIIARRATITNESDPANDFELMIYHTAQRVLHKDPQTVGIFHYEPGRPDFISYTYGRNVPESIIDYSNALRFKLKSAGIHDNKTLMGILFKKSDTKIMTLLKLKFNNVGLKGIFTSTVKFLREETIRTISH